MGELSRTTAQLIAASLDSYENAGTGPLRMEALRAVNSVPRGDVVRLVAQLAWVAGRVLAKLPPEDQAAFLADFEDSAGAIRRLLMPETD